METRILMEVEEMINRIRTEPGRAFDVQNLITSCVANVIVNMLFGRRFDHSNPDFQQLITGMHEVTANMSFEDEVFPILRILPHYKKKTADLVSTFTRLAGLIKGIIAESREVCNLVIRNQSINPSITY